MRHGQESERYQNHRRINPELIPISVTKRGWIKSGVMRILLLIECG